MLEVAYVNIYIYIYLNVKRNKNIVVVIVVKTKNVYWKKNKERDNEGVNSFNAGET